MARWIKACGLEKAALRSNDADVPECKLDRSARSKRGRACARRALPCPPHGPCGPGCSLQPDWGAEGRPQAEVETPKVVNDRSEGGVSEHRDGASGPPREVKDPF